MFRRGKFFSLHVRQKKIGLQKLVKSVVLLFFASHRFALPQGHIMVSEEVTVKDV